MVYRPRYYLNNGATRFVNSYRKAKRKGRGKVRSVMRKKPKYSKSGTRRGGFSKGRVSKGGRFKKIWKAIRRNKKATRTWSTYTVKNIPNASQVAALQNLKSWHYFTANAVSQIQNNFSSIPYFDSALGVIAAQSISDITSSNGLKISSRSSISFKNNYTQPCMIELHYVKATNNHSTTPTSALTTAAADSGATTTNTTFVISDVDMKSFKQFWKIVKSTKFLLVPGRSKVIRYKTRWCTYNEAAQDACGAEYMPSFNTCGIIYSIAGTVGHGGTSTDICKTDGYCDVVKATEYTILYNSGGPRLRKVSNSSSAYASVAAGTAICCSRDAYQGPMDGGNFNYT